jgi:hypothetical protein
MKLLLKRHPPSGTNLTPEQEQAFPSPEQIDVGELVINTVTGKLYSKLNNGSVVEFISQQICFEPSPEITFFYQDRAIVAPDYLIGDFCCAGGLLTVSIDKLKIEPVVYNFNMVELTNNTIQENISIGDPAYTTYSITNNGEIVSYRKAVVPITISFNSINYNNISLFKFVISNSNNKIIPGSEKILTMKCLESDN